MWDSSVYERFHFLISVHLKISALFVVSNFLSAEASPAVLDVKIDPRFLDPEKDFHFLWVEVTSPFSRGNRYKDYVHIFWDQILCPLNGGVPKERMMNNTVCLIKPTWMRLTYIIILHGVMAQHNPDFFLIPIYNFLKPTKFF